MRDISLNIFTGQRDTTGIMTGSEADLEDSVSMARNSPKAEWNLDFNKVLSVEDSSSRNVLMKQTTYPDSPYLEVYEFNTVHEKDSEAFLGLLTRLFKQSNLPDTCSRDIISGLMSSYNNADTMGFMNTLRYENRMKQVVVEGDDGFTCYLELVIQTGRTSAMDIIGPGKVSLSGGATSYTYNTDVYMANLAFIGSLREMIISKGKMNVKGREVYHKGYPDDHVYFNDTSMMQLSSMIKTPTTMRRHKVFTQFL